VGALLAVLVVASVVLSTVSMHQGRATAESQPVPSDPPPVPPAVPTDESDTAAVAEAAAQPATRAFGREPYHDTTAAAASKATAQRAAGCSISNASLAGIMLSITFTEAGPLASTTSAPSPMTLSRWDTQSILYAFSNPSTPYQRAFWHPGIGLWQFDHPWPNTAAERINTKTAANLAALLIGSRYCSWTSATGLTRFAHTVRPWHGCDDETGAGMRCLAIYNHHFRANGAGPDDDTLANFTLQDGVTRLGGARSTYCQLAGESTARPCLFVDAAAAQGYKGWAATSGLPTPLAAPFYVITVGSTEWRYWLRDDTGYDRDIVAKATINTNPRSTLTWQTGAGLCDVGEGTGSCPCGGRCFFLTNSLGGGTAEIVFRDAQPADQILIGDWNADGVDSLGFRKGNTYALKNTLGATAPDLTFAYGRASDAVLVGDWNGDGVDTLAVRRGSTYYLKDAFGGGAADVTVTYGRSNDVVLVGDWNGDGVDTLAVRRGSTYYLKNSFTGGAADVTVTYGRADDVVLVGDWNADNLDTLAVRRARTYYLKNSFTGGSADMTFNYGTATDITFVGDWNADNLDTLGVRR